MMDELLKMLAGNGPAWTIVAILLGGMAYFILYVLKNLFSRDENPRTGRPFGLLVPVAEAHVNTMHQLAEMAESVRSNDETQAKTLDAIRELMDKGNKDVASQFDQLTRILQEVEKRMIELAESDQQIAAQHEMLEHLQDVLFQMCDQWSVKLDKVRFKLPPITKQ